jgi:hypothetical protein
MAGPPWVALVVVCRGQTILAKSAYALEMITWPAQDLAGIR